MQTFQDKAKNDDTSSTAFQGYGDQSAFTMLPRLFMHFQFQDLSEAALKVMLYIFTHTWGYSNPCKKGQRKNADAISRKQFLEGICRADGTIIDLGAGISERSLNRALETLVEKGYIFIHHRTGYSGRHETNVYELNIDGQPHWSEEGQRGNSQDPNQSNGQGKGSGGSSVRSKRSGAGVGQDRPHYQHRATTPQPGQAQPAASSTQQQSRDIGDVSRQPYSQPEVLASSIRSATVPANLPSTHPAIKSDNTGNLSPNLPANGASSHWVNLPDTTYKLQHTTNHDTNNTDPAHSVKRETVEPGQEKQQTQSVCVDLSSNSPVKESPGAVEFGQTSSSSATPNSSTGAGYGNSYSSPSVSAASSPPQTRTQPPASTISLPSSSTSTNPAFGVLNQALLAVSVSKVEAHKLAALAVQNGHGADYVEQALAYVDAQRDVKSRPGLLIHLVKTNWQPSSVPASAGVGVSGSGETAHQSNPAAQVVGVLPTLATVNPLHVPKLIHIEARNLREATNDRQRVTAQARLERLKEIEKQLAARQSQQSLEMATMLGTLNQHTHSSNPTTFSTGV